MIKSDFLTKLLLKNGGVFLFCLFFFHIIVSEGLCMLVLPWGSKITC